MGPALFMAQITHNIFSRPAHLFLLPLANSLKDKKEQRIAPLSMPMTGPGSAGRPSLPCSAHHDRDKNGRLLVERRLVVLEFLSRASNNRRQLCVGLAMSSFFRSLNFFLAGLMLARLLAKPNTSIPKKNKNERSRSEDALPSEQILFF
jgi:hypothetical protein